MKTHSITAKSVLLAAMLCLAILAATLFAGGAALAEGVTWIGEGSGTANDPYLITNETELNYMRNMKVAGRDEHEGNSVIDGYYLLETDLNVSIFYTLTDFVGHFDGGNHTVTFDMLCDGGAGSAGMFASVWGGTVENLTVNVVCADGVADRYGVICASFYGGEIRNCHVAGNFTNLSDHPAKSYTGGICGYMSKGTIENCTSAVDITTYGNAGGIVGYMQNGTVKDATFSGRIQFKYDNYAADVKSFDSEYNHRIGGICGYAYSGQFLNCSIGCNCPIAYVGDSIDNKYIRPRVGFLIGQNNSATYRSIPISSDIKNDSGYLQHKKFLGITVYNQLEFFKVYMDNGLIGKKV